MRTLDPFRDDVAARRRVLTLLDAALAAFLYKPAVTAAWLHTPHPLLLGVTPAAAAWHSDTLAQYAKGLLEPHN